MNYLKETIEYLQKLFMWWVIIQPWERGVRVRFGKIVSVLKEGTYFRLPFFDEVHIQCVRLRIVSLPPQTVSTNDGKTLTVVASVGYSIEDIYKLYTTLAIVESTICNMVQGEIADYVANHDLNECKPNSLGQAVNEKLQSQDHGIKYDSVKITGYAVVKTFRLIQDNHWVPEGLRLEIPR